MLRAVMIIAPRDFRDEELLHTREVLEKGGVAVTVASTTLGQARGSGGAQATPDILISGIDTKEFDALIFVGGNGADIYWDDPHAHRLAKDAAAGGKVVAAICIAPVTLAKAGLLKGRRATVWPSEASHLIRAGAIHTQEPVVTDGRLITASGPTAARQFGEAVLRALRPSHTQQEQ